jgi:small subunit ribosomal protein S20
MANTRKSTKRAGQAKKRQERNILVRSATRSVLRTALDAVSKKDTAKAKDAYMAAVKALSKAASKGAIPKGRAARKISRLTRMVQKSTPEVLPKA